MEVKAERFGTTLVLAPVGRNETIGADEFQRCIDDEIEAKDEKGRPRHGRREPLTVQPGPDAPLAGRGRYWRQQFSFWLVQCLAPSSGGRASRPPSRRQAPRPQGRAGHIAAGAGRTRLTARMEGGTPSPRGPPPSHRERSRQASRRSRRLRTAMRHVSATRTVAFSATLPAPAQAVLSPCRHSASLRRPKSDRLSGKFKVRHCPPRQQFPFWPSAPSTGRVCRSIWPGLGSKRGAQCA